MRSWTNFICNLVAFEIVVWSSFAEAGSPLTLTMANDEEHPLTWTGGPYSIETSQVGCLSPDVCDYTDLTVKVSDDAVDFYQVVVLVDWDAPYQADFDVYISKEGVNLTRNNGNARPQVQRFPAENGEYTITVEPYQSYGNSFVAKVFLAPNAGELVDAAPGPVAGFQLFPAPLSVLGRGGEPSIGLNWRTGRAAISAFDNHQSAPDRLPISTYFVEFDDSQTPPKSLWIDRSPLSNLRSADPILWTHRETGHTIQSHLEGGCSISHITVDDGETWVPSEGCAPLAGMDHQTIGGGPYSAAMPQSHLKYPFAVYYCAQDISAGSRVRHATCGRSDDGGHTYGVSQFVYDTECEGLHGHLRVAPDGTVYLPNRGCGTASGVRQGLAVSTDNGTSWEIRTIPGSQPSLFDPSIAIGMNESGKSAEQLTNTIYFGMCDGDGKPKVAMSRDWGRAWTWPIMVGSSARIANCAFPAMVAGDDDRAAFFFLGTAEPGDFTAKDFAGEWFPFVATTYDGGKTWGLANAAPLDPVQVGCIWASGSGADEVCRNLFDFNDMGVDAQGRAVFVFADGCLEENGCRSGSSPASSRDALITIGRQDQCKTLFSAFDNTVGEKRCASPAGPLPVGAIQADFTAPVLSIDLKDGNGAISDDLSLSWTVSPQALGSDVVQIATHMDTLWWDSTEEPLVAGANSQWIGHPEWTTYEDPESGGRSYYGPALVLQNSTLQLSSPVSLPKGSLSLIIKERHRLDDGLHFATIEVSDDPQENWRVVARFTGAEGLSYLEAPFVERTFDLSDRATEPVYIRFRITTDVANLSVPAGLWIDDIRVTSANYSDIASSDRGSAQIRDLSEGHYYLRVLSRRGTGDNPFVVSSNVVEVDIGPDRQSERTASMLPANELRRGGAIEVPEFLMLLLLGVHAIRRRCL